MSDEELIKLLRAIKALALVPYPFPETSADARRARLIGTLGLIAGTVDKVQVLLNDPDFREVET